jgi:ABC-type glycerol-3-phosphate transport system substrate-binding protein
MKATVARRALLVNVLLVLVLVVLAACGSKATPTPQPTQAPEAAPTQAPAPEPTKAPEAAPTKAPEAAKPAEGLDCENLSGEATVWVMSFDPHVNGWNNVAEGFMKKYPNIKVNVEGQGGQGDMLAKYKAALSSKSGGDLFTTPGNMVYEWSMTDQILPLTPKLWSYEDAKKALWPEYILQSQVGNQVWAGGIPDPPGDTGLIANLDDLKEAGLEKVEKFATTEQMLEYAAKLTQKSGEQITRAGLSPRESNFGTYIYSYIADQGGKFWDNDTQKFDFNTPEAKAAMQLILDLFGKYKVDDVKLPNALDGLLQNTVAMAYMWPEFMPFAQGAAPDLKMGFIMKPAYSGDKPAIFSHPDTWSVVIPAYTKSPDLAYCVMQYLMSDEGQLLFLDANPGLSPLRSLVLENEYYKTGKGAYLKPVIEAMKAGNMRFWGPWLDGSTLQYDILYANIDAMMNGQLSLEDGLKQLTDQMNNQVAESRKRVPAAPDTTVYFDKLPDELSTASQ